MTKQTIINIAQEILNIRENLTIDDVWFMLQNFGQDFVTGFERYGNNTDAALYVLENNGY